MTDVSLRYIVYNVQDERHSVIVCMSVCNTACPAPAAGDWTLRWRNANKYKICPKVSCLMKRLTRTTFIPGETRNRAPRVRAPRPRVVRVDGSRRTSLVGSRGSPHREQGAAGRGERTKGRVGRGGAAAGRGCVQSGCTAALYDPLCTSHDGGRGTVHVQGLARSSVTYFAD